MLGLRSAVRDGSEVAVGPCVCVAVPREDSDILLEGDNDPKELAVDDCDTELVLEVLGDCRAEYDWNELPDIDRHAEGVCVPTGVYVLSVEEETAAV